MAEHLSSEQLLKYKSAFSFFDTNGDDKITVNELGSAMTSLGLKPTQGELQDIISRLDSDKNGWVSFDEFLAAIKKNEEKENSDDDLQEAFKAIDRNGDGFITTAELRQVMFSLGEKMTDLEINEIIREADVDGDERIDCQEFVFLMRNI